jgi:nucleotide-binding universal stress UspA family protein
MDPNQSPEYTTAVHDFRDARRRAAMQDLLARFRKQPSDLLSFDETNRFLKSSSAAFVGLHEIEISAIVGSVGRYKDFNRSFLPRRESDESRWARVKAQIPQVGFNPIEVYQVGAVYFVKDGNHRVSIARARGDNTIQAYITKIETEIELSQNDSADDLIRKAELTAFFKQTNLDVTRPQTDFSTTEPGAYQNLSHRIESHRNQGEEIVREELAMRWHDKDFLPFVKLMRKQGLRRDFPGRTETDLYAWILRRQEELIEQIGWEVPIEFAADNLLTKSSRRARRVGKRVKDKLTDIITPDPLESGPKAGNWRQWALSTHREDHLFTDYLVPISGSPESWIALEQALVYASIEHDYVHGLHVVPDTRDLNSEITKNIRLKFENRLKEADVLGELVVEVGNISRKICEYAAWVDAVVMNIVHPPGKTMLNKLTSGLRTTIHRSPRPLILVPSFAPKFESLLLAYDGSPKSKEALYVCAYLAGKWQMKLAVVTVETTRTKIETLQSAKDYLEKQNIEAEYIFQEGDPADEILAAADRSKCNIILMGGYGYRPVIEMVLGSAVDRVIREANVPVFLCR